MVWSYEKSRVGVLGEMGEVRVGGRTLLTNNII